MTSSINPNNIDGTYPIAGQDNDSQGFRDNFTNIKNNFTFAYDELTDLQSKAVLKSALSGGSLSNDMAYAQLVSAQLLKSVETVNNLGTKTGSFTISWADGHFQYYTTSGNTTLAFSNWPTSAYYTKLRLQITTDTTNRTVTFPAAVSVGLSDIQGAAGQVVTLPTAGVYLFELTTLDNGSTITIQDLLRNYDIVTTGSSGAFTSLNVSGNVLATGLSVFGNSTLGLAGAVSGQFHSVVGNITQTSSGGAVYINTTGNVLAAAVVAGAVTSTGTINTSGNVLASAIIGASVNVSGNVSATELNVGTIKATGLINTTGNVSAATLIAGQINTTGNVLAAAVVAGAVTSTGTINTSGNVLAASVTTGLLVNNGNLVIADPINAGSWGSNLTIKGTIHRKYRWYSNIVASSEAISLSPGGDQLLLVETSGNLDVGYNLPITPGSTVELTVKQTGGNAYVKLPNANNNLAKANVYVLGGSYTRFVFTSFGADSANVVVDTNGLA